MESIPEPIDFPFARGQSTKHRAILQAATAVFCREGLAGASIDHIASEAGVSRQTVYNQVGDKEKLFIAVVQDVTARSSARLFEVMSSFPAHSGDLETDLIEFAVRLTGRCMCDESGTALRKLIENEGQRYPELFAAWKEYGPGKTWPAMAAAFARLAHDGRLDITDTNLAARQFMALINADLPNTIHMGQPPTEEELRAAATNAVRTFLRAFGPGPRSMSRNN
jgi:AcrR family transcriptional regulator